jgi:hypothetical protein
MISSTALDLPEHRKQVFEACTCVEIFPIGMESLPARDSDAVQMSIEMVNKADIYIGIFANRYGHVPQGHNISVTEMEFNRAIERRIPILIFIAHKDHLFTADAIETRPGAQTKLQKLKKLASKGRGRCEFKSPIELRGQVIHALSDIKKRELESRSPIDAIRAEKERLEALDPNASVQIAANEHSMQYSVNFPHGKLEFLHQLAPDQLKNLIEKGQSFQIRAKDIPADISPILNSFLAGAGDQQITIHTSAKFRGCLQFMFPSSQDSSIQIQADGEWTLGQKRAVFVGQLSDSPFWVEYIRETGEAESDKRCVIKCSLEFNEWMGQPLLGLAYFSEINDFIHHVEFSVRSMIRGNQVWPDETITTTDIGRKRAIDGLEWLYKCRSTAKYLHVNPVFPKAETINADHLESQNVQLMVKLIEVGVHEQDNAGKEMIMWGEGANEEIPVGKKQLTVNWTEHRVINFFGVEIPFGPLAHTWTDLEIVEARQLTEIRREMTFNGGPTSTWKIEYKRPS